MYLDIPTSGKIKNALQTCSPVSANGLKISYIQAWPWGTKLSCPYFPLDFEWSETEGENYNKI